MTKALISTLDRIPIFYYLLLQKPSPPALPTTHTSPLHIAPSITPWHIFPLISLFEKDSDRALYRQTQLDYIQKKNLPNTTTPAQHKVEISK